MVRLAAENPTTGAFNCGDPDPPNVRRIADSIAAAMGHRWEEVLLPRESSRERKVRSPWGGFHPLVVSMDKAREELSYEPVTGYDSAIVETVDWIVSTCVVRIPCKRPRLEGRRFSFVGSHSAAH
jgi:nucleoside-diphosphate-sugar epimerase